jgi:hypothetical protein
MDTVSLGLVRVEVSTSKEGHAKGFHLVKNDKHKTALFLPCY